MKKGNFCLLIVFLLFTLSIAACAGNGSGISSEETMVYSPGVKDEPPPGIEPGEPIAAPEDEEGYVTLPL